MPGPKPSVPHNTIVKVLKTLKIINNQGKLKKQREGDVWKTACILLDNKIKVHNLYCYVQGGQNGIYLDLNLVKFKKEVYLRSSKQFKQQLLQEKWEKNEKKKEKNGSHENYVEYYNDEIDDNQDLFLNSVLQDDEIESDFEDNFVDKREKKLNPHSCKPLNFQFHLNETEWNIIKPVFRISCKNSLELKLNNHWTDIFVKKIWYSKKIPCPFAFRTAKVLKTDPNRYFHFYGQCRDCKTCISGYSSQDSLDDDRKIGIYISTYDTSGIKHEHKRKFTGDERRATMDKMVHQKASAFKLDQINKYIKEKKAHSQELGVECNIESDEESDVLPPFIHDTFIYRKTRQQGRDHYIGLDGPKDLTKSLQHISDKLHPVIRHYSTIPFKVF